MVAWVGLSFHPMNILKLLDRPIAFHRSLVEPAGSVNAALMLSQAIYWALRIPKERDGWFWKTAEEWQAEIGLTRAEQEGARKRLIAANLLEEKLEGIPAKLHFRVIETSLRKSAKLDEVSLPNSLAEKCQTPNNTETTSESTHKEAGAVDGGVQGLRGADTRTYSRQIPRLESAPNPSGTVRNHQEPPSPNGVRGIARGGVDGVNSEELPEPLSSLKLKLCFCFDRDLDDRWGNEEKHLLVEIGSRPNVIEEMDRIQRLYDLTGRKRLPRTIRTLMNDWGGVNDRAKHPELEINETKPNPIDRNVGTYNDAAAQADVVAAARRSQARFS